MIGNDVIDLKLASQESNWNRKGFLEKLFTASEQERIHNTANPSQMVWVLWSIKESVYKAYLRIQYNRGFYPSKIEIKSLVYRKEEYSSTILLDNHTFFGTTKATKQSIHTVAVHSDLELNNVMLLNENALYTKNSNGLPFELHTQREISVSHHGKFKQIIGLR